MQVPHTGTSLAIAGRSTCCVCHITFACHHTGLLHKSAKQARLEEACLGFVILLLQAFFQGGQGQGCHATAPAICPHMLQGIPRRMVMQGSNAVIPACHQILYLALRWQGLHLGWGEAGARSGYPQLPLTVVAPYPDLVHVCECDAVAESCCELYESTVW